MTEKPNDTQMMVKPKLAYYHFGYNQKLDPEKVYPAIIATNQPDYESKGLIFVEHPKGGPEFLLSSNEYIVVSKENETS